MKKSLTLKTERLTSLSEEELRLAAAAGADDTWTGQVHCVVSIGRCVTSLCSYVDCAIKTIATS